MTRDFQELRVTSKGGSDIYATVNNSRGEVRMRLLRKAGGEDRARLMEDITAYVDATQERLYDGHGGCSNWDRETYIYMGYGIPVINGIAAGLIADKGFEILSLN